VKIRFWEVDPPSSPIGIIIAIVNAKHFRKYEHTNFYKVWVNGVLAEFAIEELEAVQEISWQKTESE
tara:strand:- start:771 stop:971 length:201 start_codon:yes stop_codon:yes gene_type:complete